MAGWEYPGAYSEVFDLDAFLITDDPEGFGSCADGFGGLLVAAYDALSQPNSIRVSRVAPDGTEMWGQGGVFAPRELGSLGQHSPIGVAPDGTGGVYVAYVEIWPSYELFRLAHFTSTGAFDRTTSVDNTGSSGDYQHLSIKLVPIANGDVLAAWTQRTPTPKLHAARFSMAGALLWHTDVNQNYSHRETVGSNTRTCWYVASDMLDGMLVTWLRLQVGTPEIGAQRIGPNGSVWWGSDGHLLWSGYPLDFHDPVIVGDVIGGAFVVMSHQGMAKAQHLDPWGTEQWPAGGILVQNSNTPYYAQSTEPAVCEDGAFGFIVVHGNEDLFGQRVDYWGNLLWGVGVDIGHRAGQQNKPDIAPDGAQGAVVVWQDMYYATPGQPWRVLAGMQLDGSGGAVWGPADLYMAWTVHDPHDAHVVADGAGVGLCAFANYDLMEFSDDVWAIDVTPGASPVWDPHEDIPIATALHAYPNPFNGLTQLVAQVPEVESAQLRIYDLTGRLIRTIAAGVLAPGPNSVWWDGRDDSGRPVGQGVYLVRMDAGSFSTSCRVVFLR